jgi:hypothetical protein
VGCLVEFEHHSPRVVKRPLQMEFVDPSHQGQIVGAGDRPGAIVLARPTALPLCRIDLGEFRSHLEQRSRSGVTRLQDTHDICHEKTPFGPIVGRQIHWLQKVINQPLTNVGLPKFQIP